MNYIRHFSFHSSHYSTNRYIFISYCIGVSCFQLFLIESNFALLPSSPQINHDYFLCNELHIKRCYNILKKHQSIISHKFSITFKLWLNTYLSDCHTKKFPARLLMILKTNIWTVMWFPWIFFFQIDAYNFFEIK